jgi:hypothetical protein
MEKEDFHKDEFYDAYVLGRLTADDEDLFEEHLLFCEHCRKEIEIREISIAGVVSGEDITRARAVKIKFQQKGIVIRLAIAASVIMLAGFSLYIIIKPAGEKTLVEKEKNENVPEDRAGIADTSYVTEPLVKPETEQPTEILVAEAFKPYPLFENAIENQLRSSVIIVLSPSLSQVFKISDTIEFRWKNGAQELRVAIFNNKGEMILESVAESPFLYENKFTSGLYYWQLETEDEALHTSKFIIQSGE